MIARAIRYSGPSARIRALFGDLLQANDYVLLLNAAGIEDLLAALRTTVYGRDLHIEDRSFAFALQRRWIARTERVASILPPQASELCLAYLAKVEVEALKTLLRGIARGMERERLISMLDPLPAGWSIPLDALLASSSLKEAVRALSDTTYEKAAAEGLQQGGGENGKAEPCSLVPSEAALERQFFLHLIGACRRFSGSERTIVGRLVGVFADVANILRAQRLRKTFHLSPQAVAAHLVPFGFRLGQAEHRALCNWSGEGVPPVWLGTRQPPAELRVAAMRILCDEAAKPLFNAPFQAGLAIAYIILSELEGADLITIYEGKRWHLERSAIAELLLRFHGPALAGAAGV